MRLRDVIVGQPGSYPRPGHLEPRLAVIEIDAGTVSARTRLAVDITIPRPLRDVQWSWNCYVHGKPGASANGTGVDLDDCKARFKVAWSRIRAGLTDDDIAKAHEYADASAEALAGYDRK